jgi:CheY-like chemotaxis protein
MDGNDIFIKFLDILPSIFWTILVASILYRYRLQIEEALKHLGSVKIFGIEAEFSQARQQDLKQAVKSYELTTNAEELTAVVDRANRLREKLFGSRMLWVDDNIYANANIFRFLNSYGVEIDKVASTEDALPALKWGSSAYDAIITDMKRGDEVDAGIQLIGIARTLDMKKPIIILVVELDENLGTPIGATAITDSPIQLIHYYMDVLDRKPVDS